MLEKRSLLILDAGEKKFAYGGQPDSLLLRSFSTDEDFRMRGYGSQTLKLLPDFVREHLLMYKSIILGVNERNQVASYLYRETGFSKQPQRILGTSRLAGSVWNKNLKLSPVWKELGIFISTTGRNYKRRCFSAIMKGVKCDWYPTKY